MKSLTQFACLLALPVLTLSLSSVAFAADSSSVSAADKMFVKKAAIGGMFEVETGKIAQDKGADQGVKDFGAKMVEDHGKANDELKSIASSKGIEVPTALDAKHQKMVDSLNSMSGAAFDKAYIKDMTMAHDMDDKLFMKEAQSGKDSDLMAFASKTDQVIKMHIQMLNDLKSKMTTK
jgi:putative membrane protein